MYRPGRQPHCSDPHRSRGWGRCSATGGDRAHTGLSLSLSLALFCCLLLIPASAAFGQHGLDVIATDASVFSVEPREVVTRVFRITNRSGAPGTFEGRLALPTDWRAITPEFPFELAAGATTLRLVSFFAPADTAAGEYRVDYQVSERERRGLSGGATLRVRVLPVYRLQADILELPTVAIAGESYTARFQISNHSNAALAVGFGIDSSRDSQLKPVAGSLTLAAGESVPIEVAVTPPALTEAAHDQLTLTAQAPAQGLTDEAKRSVEVLPRVSGQVAPYHTLPTRFTRRIGANWQRRGPDAGAGRVGADGQLEWSGAGYLDGTTNHYLSFLLRGPDLDEASIFGQESLFWLDYRGKHVDVGLGNLSFELSPLTISGTGGIGARVGWRDERWRATGFYAHDWNSDDNWDIDDSGQEVGLGLAHALREDWWIGLNYLHRQDATDGDNQVLSLRSRSQLRPDTTLDLELAGSTGALGTGAAARLDLLKLGAPWRYRVTALHADPHYAGQYRDQTRIHLDLGYDPLAQPWSLTGFYRYDRYNRAQQRLDYLDPERFGYRERPIWITEPAREEQEAGLGIQWRTERAGRYRAELRYNECHNTWDNGRPFADVTHALRLGWGNSFSKQNLTLDGSVDIGRRDDRVTGERVLAHGYRAALSWRPTNRLSLGGYVNHSIDPCMGLDGRDSSPTFGVNAGLTVSPRSTLNLNVQAQDSADETPDQIQVVANAQYSYRRDNGHVIGLQAQYANGPDEDANLMLSYMVPVAVPTVRRGELKTLGGRVFDQETGAGLANVVLRLGRLVAITDERGAFSFLSVPRGYYDLSVGGGQLPVGMIPVVALPLPVDLATESSAQVDIAYIRGATIGGRVQRYEPDPSLLPSQTFVRLDRGRAPPPPAAVTELTPTTGLRGVLVEVRNGEQVYRRLTNGNGEFSFAGLHPGTWTVSIDRAAIPQNASIDETSFTRTLAPKDDQQVEFRVEQRIRSMRMLAPLKVSG